MTNSKAITESDKVLMEQSRTKSVHFDRTAIINLCVKMGAYSQKTGDLLLRGEVPPTTLTPSERRRLEARDAEREYLERNGVVTAEITPDTPQTSV